VKAFLILFLVSCSFQNVWGMAPGDSSTRQPSMMMSPFQSRKQFFGLRYEKETAPEFTDQTGATGSFPIDSTYCLQFGVPFGEKWMWGLQAGPLRLRLPLFPTGNLQYEFFRSNLWSVSGGMFLGYMGNFRYGAGLTSSWYLSSEFRIFALGQWLSDQSSYESARGRDHDNFWDVSSESTLFMLGGEVLLPSIDKKARAQFSLAASFGYQTVNSYKTYYEESPAHFKYNDGMSGYVEIRLYAD
jgi:hypothetical protein